TYIEVAVGQDFLELVERGALGHRGGNADDSWVAACQLDQRLTKDILIFWWLVPFLLHLASNPVICARPIELGPVSLREITAAVLLGDDLNHDGAVDRLGAAEDLDHLLGIVTVEGA